MVVVMNKQTTLLLGDEALALAAIDGGVKAIFGYPGTPSTEIIEAAENYIKQLDHEIIAEWAANEKVAYEFALGTSYTGQRTVVTMKHVGLNVALDAFVNSAITGVNGGFVVAIADDPGMHSSQNEQDSRILSDFAHVLTLEPTSPQEVYDFTIKAFEISENLQLPVVLRLVTRLAHARGEVTRIDKKISPTDLGVPPESDKNNWVLIPGIARGRNVALRKKLEAMIQTCAPFNQLIDNATNTGVILAGMGQAYFDHFLSKNGIDKNKYNQLRIAGYPIDYNLIKNFTQLNDTLYVFEENYPYIEDMFIPYADGKAIIHGRRDKTIPVDGELSLASIRKALGYELPKSKISPRMKSKIDQITVPRPPKLCDGCGHSDAFKSIKAALKNIGVVDPSIFGDIGCYTLGVLPPRQGINTCVEMGASISMAYGAAVSGYSPSIGIIGDSTFFHSGMTSLVSIAKARVNVNLVIMDNAIVGMTGQQPPVTSDISVELAKATGMSEDDIYVLKPITKKLEYNTGILEKVFQHKGPNLIIFKRECIMAMRRKIYPFQKKVAAHG